MADPSSNTDRDTAAVNPAPKVLSSPSPPVPPIRTDAEENVAERLSGNESLNDIALAEDEVVRVQGPICAGRFFKFMFQRVTYYWFALLFQVAQTGLAGASCVIIRTSSYLEYDYYVLTTRQTFYIIAALSTCILISLIYL
ncbi:hypothetical protein D9613_010274 [Agrocybe pediades]|uniref:Uncharacterized protein n=1 Tax=Agrocybe pediades TaxID=84607 RepID=A0A8H4QFG8_9AGAR|nr:hypothetical protein D9613_010274 [Agrocybe pediades]